MARYGITNKYNMPKFKPAPIPISPLLTLFSTVALHMAHCAQSSDADSKSRIGIIANIFLKALILMINTCVYLLVLVRIRSNTVTYFQPLC